MELWLSVAIAALGVAAVGAAGFSAFRGSRGKRLSYGVEMDASTSDRQLRTGIGPLEALGLTQRPLNDPSLVLLRIENRGSVPIDTPDYLTHEGEAGSIEVRFPGRTVMGAAVAGSSDNLPANLQTGYPMAMGHGVLRLPSVPMHPASHYEVLAALDRAAESHLQPDRYPPPEFVGSIRGGRVEGSLRRGGGLRLAVGLVAFLVVLVVAQVGVFAAAG